MVFLLGRAQLLPAIRMNHFEYNNGYLFIYAAQRERQKQHLSSIKLYGYKGTIACCLAQSKKKLENQISIGCSHLCTHHDHWTILQFV